VPTTAYSKLSNRYSLYARERNPSNEITGKTLGGKF
jgi:hypothetical protein